MQLNNRECPDIILKDDISDFIDFFNRTLAKPFRWTYEGKPLVA